MSRELLCIGCRSCLAVLELAVDIIWQGPSRSLTVLRRAPQVSKLGKQFKHGAVCGGGGGTDGPADTKADDLQQMFIAMTEEERVIIVKLADRLRNRLLLLFRPPSLPQLPPPHVRSPRRLHNMRTLEHMPSHKQARIAKETLEVFAPLARLLGMYRWGDGGRCLPQRRRWF